NPALDPAASRVAPRLLQQELRPPRTSALALGALTAWGARGPRLWPPRVECSRAKAAARQVSLAFLATTRPAVVLAVQAREQPVQQQASEAPVVRPRAG